VKNRQKGEGKMASQRKLSVTKIVGAAVISLALLSSAYAGESENRDSTGGTAGYSKAWSDQCNDSLDSDQFRDLEPNAFPSQAEMWHNKEFMRSHCDQYVQAVERPLNQPPVVQAAK